MIPNDWEIDLPMTLEDLLYKGVSPSLADFIQQFAKEGAKREILNLLKDPEEQERMKSILTMRVAKRKKYLDYAKRDLADFENLLKKVRYHD